MSIPVTVADIERTLGDFDAGYLLTASADGRVKAVSVVPRMRDGLVVIASPGRGSLANVIANPAVTLLFPPREAPGHSFLVDGTASTAGDDVLVTPSGAVLHRPVDAS